MAKEAGDESLAHLGQPALGARLVEGVGLTLEQGQVEMHPRAVVILEGFRHEGGVYPRLEGDLFHGEPRGHDVVRHREGICVAGDDLVLARRYLVM
jgi:hypothetical protein